MVRLFSALVRDIPQQRRRLGFVHENVLKLIIKILEDFGKSFVAPAHSVKGAIAVKVGLPGAPQQGKLVIKVSAAFFFFFFFFISSMLQGVCLVNLDLHRY